MGKKTQIVQDKSEVCVSGSWFISGGSVLACVTRSEHRVLTELRLQTWSTVFRKSWKPELNQLGDTDALYLEAQRRVGRLSEEITVYSEIWVL